MAVIELEFLAFVGLVQIIDVLATLALTTEFLARNGGDARARVHNQCLWLAVRPKVHRDIVVHKVGRIAIEGCC